MEEKTGNTNKSQGTDAEALSSPFMDAGEYTVGARLKSQIVCLTAVRVVPGISERMVYPFLSIFARGLGVGLPAMSLAVSTRAFIGVFGPVLTAAIEQYGRKPGILLGLALVILSSILMVIYPTYASFFLFLCLGYIGSIIVVTSQQAFIGDRIPYIQRGRVIGLVETSWAISFIFGMPVLAVLIGRWGWKAPFPFIAILGTVFFIVVKRSLPAEAGSRSLPELGDTWKKLWSAIKHPSARAALFYTIFLIAANECVGLVFGVWIADTLGNARENLISIEVAALGTASVLIGFAELAGELLSGGIVDRFGKERSIRAGVVLNCAVAFLLPWLGRNLWGAYFGLFFFYLTFEFSVVAGITMMTEILPSMRGTLLGLTNGAAAFGRMSGALLASAMYSTGFHINTSGVIVLNIACLYALSKIQVQEQSDMVRSDLLEISSMD